MRRLSRAVRGAIVGQNSGQRTQRSLQAEHLHWTARRLILTLAVMRTIRSKVTVPPLIAVAFLVGALISCGQKTQQAGENAAGATPSSVAAAVAQGATTQEGRLAQQSVFGSDLAIALAGPRTAAVGDRLELAITITNHGPKRPPLSASIELTSHLAFRGSSSNCQEYRPQGGISCTLPTPNVGETITGIVSADLTTRPADGRVLVTANVGIGVSDVLDTQPDNNNTELPIEVAP